MKRSRAQISRPDFEELSSYLDGELSPERLQEIDIWLADNPEALNRLKKMRKIEKALRAGKKHGNLKDGARKPPNRKSHLKN